MKKTMTASLTLFFIVCVSTASATGLSSYLVKDQKELQILKKKMDDSSQSLKERHWLKWQYVLNAPQFDQTSEALTALSSFQKSKQKLIGEDQIELTRGRILFQSEKFEEAIEAYQKVPKSSEFWFEAMEEEIWSYIRIQEHDKATAKLATLFNPVFSTWVGPETYFAANYNALKICDYNNIFKNGKNFKSRHKNRIKALEQLAQSGDSPQVDSVISKMTQKKLSFNHLAKESASLPRFFWRDEFLRELGQAAKIDITKVKQRFKALAKAELSDYSTVIQKLQIIEAEVIQRMYLDDNLKGDRPELEVTSSKDPNVLNFPYDEDSQKGELWIDEVDRLKANVQSCPKLDEVKL